MRFIDEVSGYVKNYPEEVSRLAGIETKLASMSQDEVNILAKMLDKILYIETNEAVKKLYSENFDVIVDVVRAVKTETKQEFAGPRATGNQLTIVDLTPDVFTRVWGATGASDFTYVAASTGVVDYIGTSANPEVTAEEEGLVILGFVELAMSPKINKVQFTKNGTPYVWNNLKFETDDSFYVAALPEPWVILPESTYFARVNFFKTGKTELVPLGVKVLQAKRLL